jgi:RNA polymerase-associated protein CTR9
VYRDPGRSVDIELGTAEVITIDLDNLDPNPEDVLDLLKDGQCKIWVWTKLAGEYWRRGYLEAAEKIAHAAIECEFINFLYMKSLIPSGQHFRLMA